MTGFRFSAAFRLICLLVALLGNTLPAVGYCQQEVDPMWYDPWPATRQDGAHPSQAPATSRLKRRKSGPASLRASPAESHRGKRMVDRRRAVSMLRPPAKR